MKLLLIMVASAERIATRCWRILLLALKKQMYDDAAENILEWELAQHKILDEVADRCGWTYDHRDYKSRIRMIQQQVKLRMKALQKSHKEFLKGPSTAEDGTANQSSESRVNIQNRPPPTGWDLAPSSEPNGRKFKSLKEAEVLLGPAKYSEWKLDRDAPSGHGVRRYITQHPKRPQTYERRRLVWSKKGFSLFA